MDLAFSLIIMLKKAFLLRPWNLYEFIVFSRVFLTLLKRQNFAVKNMDFPTCKSLVKYRTTCTNWSKFD